MKKKTTKIIVSILAGLTLLIMIAVAVPYFFRDSLVVTRANTETVSDAKTMSVNIKSFDKIAVSGSWEVQINQGKEYSVKVKAPEEYIAKSCSVKNGELIINKLADNLKQTPYIEITLPVLSSVHVIGASEIRLVDFNGAKQAFALVVEGATSFRAERATFDKVTIACQGASNIEFRNCIINQAEINVAGASNVELDRMNGGELTGALEGVAALHYSGNVSANKIKASGLAVVKQN